MNGRNVMSEIREWVINYKSHYNDGWTKQHYERKLRGGSNYLGEVLENEKVFEEGKPRD